MLHPRKSILASLACAALIAVTGTSAAQAAPRTNSPLTESVTESATRDTTTDAATSQQINDYWTPERRQNALVPVLTKNASGTVTRTLQSQTVATASESEIIDLPNSPIAGKIFYYNPVSHEDEACSGTVVDAPSESLVLTAAHCLRTGGNNGTWFENVMFYPDYTPGGAADGFVWFKMRVTQRWVTHGDVARDVGTLAVEKLNGTTLETHTGNGATFVYNQGLDTPKDIITQAYPHDVNNGWDQVACHAMTASAQPAGWANVGLAIPPGCELGPGASGSGWIRHWGENNHEIVGLTSSMSPQDNSSYSPYFDGNTNVQYTTMKNEFPPN